MNKQQYISELESRLKRLPREEIEDVIQYYLEYFEDAELSSNDDVLSQLDAPSNVASQILSQYALKDEVEVKKKRPLSSVWFVILAILAAPIGLPLAVAGIAIIFAFLMVILAVIFAFSTVTISLVGSGIFAVIIGISIIASDFATTLCFVGIGLATISIGILFGLLVWILAPKAVNLVSNTSKKILIKFNKKSSQGDDR